MDVEVETEKGDCVEARSYQIIRPLDDDRRPSYVYMDVIIRGAKENGLPEVKYTFFVDYSNYWGPALLML